MGKRQDFKTQRQQVGDEPDGQPSPEATTSPPPSLPEVKEHLRRDLARVRAKFAMDTPPGAPSLTGAWMSEMAVEEDEAEFVDTLADCLGAGLSLQDALTCWETGDLAADDADAAAAEEEQTVRIVPALPRRPTGGHRLLVR